MESAKMIIYIDNMHQVDLALTGIVFLPTSRYRARVDARMDDV